jgi:hypothetical protein
VEDVPWIDCGATSPAELSSAALVVSMVGYVVPSEERAATLAALAARFASGRRLIVVDHNRPRSPVSALTALVRPPWVPGWSPFSRWRRLAHPTAREVQAAGFRVDRLRLVAGELVQIVVATRA